MPLFLFPPFPSRPEPVEATPGSPTQEEAVQNEIDYYNQQNQTDWSGTQQHQATQNELDYNDEQQNWG